jgi:WD40 repeat protein
MPKGARYHGFISYSHAVDGKFAPAIQRALHSLARPWYRLRALHVFRDETSLSANPGLWSSIEKALSESHWFIYLASPRAAESEWVRREIDWWLTHRGPATMLIVLTEGRLRWDDTATDFDWNTTNALPRELARHLPAEPLWVDLSWARHVDNLNLRHSQFRAAVLRLAAPMHGRAPDELDGDDVRQYRRTRWTARAAIATLVLLTAASVTAAYLAVQRSRESVSRELAMQSLRQLETDPELSLRLAMHAVENKETQQAEEALRRALAESKVRETFQAPGQVSTAKYSPDGRTILVAAGRSLGLFTEGSADVRVLSQPDVVLGAELSSDGRLVAAGSLEGKARVWETTSGKLLAEVQAAAQGNVQSLALSPDGTRLLTVGFGVKDFVDNAVARVWDTKTGTLVAELKGHTAGIAAARFDASGKYAATGGWDNTVRIWAIATGALLRTLTGHTGPVTAVAFSPDGAVVVSGSADLTVRAWNAATGALQATGGIAKAVGRRATLSRIAAVSPSTRRALTSDPSRTTIYDPHTGKALRDLADFPSACHKAAFSHDDRLLACPGADGTAFVWDVETAARIATFRGHRGELNDVAFRPNGRMLLTSGTDNTAREWAIEPETRDLLLGGHSEGVQTAVWSPDGRLAATGSWDGGVRVWDTLTGSPVSVWSSQGRVTSVSFSADSRRLLVARLDRGGAHVLDARTGSVFATMAAGKLELTLRDAGNWTADDRIVLLGAAEEATLPRVNGALPSSGDALDLSALLPVLRGELLRWDASSGRPLAALPAGKGSGHSTQVTWGYSRAAGIACLKTDDETVSRVWNVRDGSMVSELKGHLAGVRYATLSPDGRLVAFTDQDRVEVWDTRPCRTTRSPTSSSIPAEPCSSPAAARSNRSAVCGTRPRASSSASFEAISMASRAPGSAPIPASSSRRARTIPCGCGASPTARTSRPYEVTATWSSMPGSAPTADES